LLRGVLRDCGVAFEAESVRAVVEWHLQNASSDHGQAPPPAPAAEQAKREIRATALADAQLDELGERARDRVPEREFPALPAPQPPRPEGEDGERRERDWEAAERAELGAVRVVRTTRERRANAAGERSGRPGRKCRPGYVVQPDGGLRLMTDEEHEQLERQRAEELAQREGRPPPPDCCPEAGTVR